MVLPWIQTAVLKPDFEEMAALLSGERLSRSGLLCGCQAALLPLHMSHSINRPHVTRLLERSPLHYAGNTLPADGLEDTKPVFGVNVIFERVEALMEVVRLWKMMVLDLVWSNVLLCVAPRVCVCV